jgi:hypothetical protein
MPLSLMPLELSTQNLDRHESVFAGIIVIESSCKSFTFIDREIELELVTSPSRRIRPGSVRRSMHRPRRTQAGYLLSDSTGAVPSRKRDSSSSVIGR